MAALGAIAKSYNAGVFAAPTSQLWYLQQGAINVTPLPENSTISGTVQVEGSAAAGILVQLIYVNLVIRKKKTDASGGYSFTNLSPDLTYDVLVRTPDVNSYNDVVYRLPPVV